MEAQQPEEKTGTGQGQRKRWRKSSGRNKTLPQNQNEAVMASDALGKS